MRQKDKKRRADEIRPVEPMALTDMGHAETDPQGSWTGVPADPYETPVQDADDL